MVTLYKKMINNAIYNNIPFTIVPTKYVAPYSQTKWLVFSSCFFLIPSFYGFIGNQLFFAIISLLTSVCSMNYWRDATYSYRRCIDHIMAKISFTIYFINGVYYININNYMPFIVTGYGAFFLLLYCYYMSHKWAHTNMWWKYHMMFHLLISYGMTITIKSVIAYEKQKQIR